MERTPLSAAVRLWWRPPCLLRRVVVNLRENPNEGFRCVLWSQRGGWLTLRDVEALASGQPATKMIGDVVIHVDRVAFFEVVE